MRIQFLPLSRKACARWTARQVGFNTSSLRCRYAAIQVFKQALFISDIVRRRPLRFCS